MATRIPTRLLVVQRLCALLQGPLDYKGTQVTLTEDQVFRGRNLFGEEAGALDNLPVISVIENPRPDIAFYAGLDLEVRKDMWTLLITGMVEDDKLFPGDNGYWFYAAVEERLARILATGREGDPKYPEHHMLGNTITSLEISPPVIRPPENKAVSAKAYFFLPLRVGIGSRLGAPYTSVP